MLLGKKEKGSRWEVDGRTLGRREMSFGLGAAIASATVLQSGGEVLETEKGLDFEFN